MPPRPLGGRLAMGARCERVAWINLRAQLTCRVRISSRSGDWPFSRMCGSWQHSMTGRPRALSQPPNPVTANAVALSLSARDYDFGDDVPVDQNFHARRLPDHTWRHSKRSDSIEAVIQLHRLREVLALVGFTRFEAVTPDINGEYETDVERAQIALVS